MLLQLCNMSLPVAVPDCLAAVKHVMSDVNTHLTINIQTPLPAGSNETLCPSQSKLTGTTTIVAKPGMGDKLMEMVATMPGKSYLHAELQSAMTYHRTNGLL